MSAKVHQAAAGIVGAQNVLEARSDAFQAVIRRLPVVLGTQPSYLLVARPSTAEELGSLIRLARQQHLGVHTLFGASTVGSRLRGDGDSVVLDMSRMNKVLEVEPRYGYARVEPGVTYLDLARHLHEHRIPLLVDSERDPNTSLAGSFLSKGYGCTPYGDHVLMQCGSEFVLPDGSLVRTGMGAMPNNRAWQLYKFSLGPYADGLAIQSDIAIPTQMGVWLMGQPPAYRPFAVELEDEAAIAAAVEMLRPLKINNTLPGAITVTHRDFDKARMPAAASTAAWRLTGALYGIPEVVALTAPVVESGLKALPGARLVTSDELAANGVWQEQLSLLAGKPGLAGLSFPALASTHSAKLVFVAPLEGHAATQMKSIVERTLRSRDQPLLMEYALVGRSLLQTVHLVYDPEDGAGLRALAQQAAELIAEMGKATFGVAAESPELSRVVEKLLGQGGLGQLQARLEAAFAS
jgi:4-cresol dehydrogenase (hydroxylating) flavoprotein subunit